MWIPDPVREIGGSVWRNDRLSRHNPYNTLNGNEHHNKWAQRRIDVMRRRQKVESPYKMRAFWCWMEKGF